jgi:hypothetical protein
VIKKTVPAICIIAIIITIAATLILPRYFLFRPAIVREVRLLTGLELNRDARIIDWNRNGYFFAHVEIDEYTYERWMRYRNRGTRDVDRYEFAIWPLRHSVNEFPALEDILEIS